MKKVFVYNPKFLGNNFINIQNGIEGYVSALYLEYLANYKIEEGSPKSLTNPVVVIHKEDAAMIKMIKENQ